MSAYLLPGRRSRHNFVYWQRRPYEAIGPGAHAFDGTTRRWNAARLDGYVAALNGPGPSLPPGGSERLDPETAAAETVILALRTDRGVPVEIASEPPLERVGPWAEASGLIARDDDRLVLTTRGRLLSNEVFSRLVSVPSHR